MTPRAMNQAAENVYGEQPAVLDTMRTREAPDTSTGCHAHGQTLDALFSEQ